MPLPIPFPLRTTQTAALTHAQLDGNLSILSDKIDNTTITNVGTGIGMFTTKAVHANDGVMNLHTLAGTGGISVVAGSDGIIIDGSGISGGSGTNYYTTGLTFNQGTYDLTVSVNDGNDYTVGLGILSSDMNITGGTYDPGTGIATFTNNSGSTFQVSGFLVGYTDTNTYVTGGTHNQSTGISTFTNSSGGTFEVVGYFTGGTSNFDWCDAYVMSGNTSGCCIDTLWVTTLSGCSPIHIGGANRVQGVNGNVNVDGILNIKNKDNVITQPNNNKKTAHMLVWNSQITTGDLTIGDVEYVYKKQLFKEMTQFFTPWEPAGPIEIGTDPTGAGIGIVIGPTEAIELVATTAGTQISLTYSSATVTASTVTTPLTVLMTRQVLGSPLEETSIDASGVTTTGTVSANAIIVDGTPISGIDAYYSGGTPAGNWTWDLSGQSTNFEITLVAGTSQLDLTNVINGEYGTVIVHQDTTGGRALTFGTINGGAGTHYVVNGGGGVPTLTSTANAIDILSFTYNGTAAFWTAGGDYN